MYGTCETLCRELAAKYPGNTPLMLLIWSPEEIQALADGMDISLSDHEIRTVLARLEDIPEDQRTESGISSGAAMEIINNVRENRQVTVPAELLASLIQTAEQALWKREWAARDNGLAVPEFVTRRQAVVNQARSLLTVILKPWNERQSERIDEVMNRVRTELSRYPESKVYLSTPAVIPGLGSSGGFEMVLEARGSMTYEELQRAVDTLMHYAGQRPELTGLASSMQGDIPQLYFDVDRDKAQMQGVTLSDIFSTMKAFTGSIYVNDFNMFNRIYRVYIQAEAPYRAYRDNLNLFFVRGSNGTMIPVTSLGTTDYTTGPGTIKRFNMFNSATVTGEAAHGYSSGQAMKALEEVVHEHLPPSVGVEWSGLSYQEKHEGGKTGFVLALAFLFVFLFLAAQYESWWIPVAVLLSLPVAGIGAYMGIWLCGLENNVYFQIGLVMLVGLVAKNAILIVEFAKEAVEKGQDTVTAALTAAHLRFRPIVMTSLAFILGLLPLVFASGPGSASRQGIGTGVFFGMLVAITVGIVFVPFFFVWIYRIKAKLKR